MIDTKAAPVRRTQGGIRFNCISGWLINRLGRRWWLILQWTNALFSWMLRNVNLDFTYVVKVIELRKLMAETEGILKRTRLPDTCYEWWINSDPDDVVAWRNWRLPIGTVQNEVLARKLPNISICPTDTDTLIAHNG